MLQTVFVSQRLVSKMRVPAGLNVPELDLPRPPCSKGTTLAGLGLRLIYKRVAWRSGNLLGQFSCKEYEGCRSAGMLFRGKQGVSDKKRRSTMALIQQGHRAIAPASAGL